MSKLRERDADGAEGPGGRPLKDTRGRVSHSRGRNSTGKRRRDVSHADPRRKEESV